MPMGTRDFDRFWDFFDDLWPISRIYTPGRRRFYYCGAVYMDLIEDLDLFEAESAVLG